MVVWAIWTAINSKLWGSEQHIIPNVIMRRAIDWWQDFMKVTATPTRTNVQFVIPRWLCPPSSKLKVNVDGAWNKDLRLGGVGIAIMIQMVNVLSQPHESLIMFFAHPNRCVGR